jgi:hypothetical protein
MLRPPLKVSFRNSVRSGCCSTSSSLYASNLARDPKVGEGRRVIFVSGDDGDAKGEVSGLLKGLGFAVINLGSLSEGGRAQQVGNGLAGVDFVQLGD